MATSLAVVGIAALLPFTPLGIHFGLVPPPAKFYFFLGAMVLIYLMIVEMAKQRFYRWSGARIRPRRPAVRTSSARL
jgi:Mg2+-importing ATPase